ncbi:aminodeoxychorismate synthase component I [Terriglobus saanensis]|uniref:Para-aminobenzoate synthase, subunit I n=1 Tax=Terriglobus saanensis (strain ATCC BAA-1853 / DSM 23119 / SP1PR4) TaxID=401053 RepID=E8V414_TERSS|nr:aminodeoxychorismate synthase component I [Terriglobus saanensis]ADV82505.1 para-aminobenzoate synthase, subunit I [Terriglobus saanensis SP1PR4]
MSSFAPLPSEFRRLAAETPDSVLLETARASAHTAKSYLFLHPERILTATTLSDIPALFQQIDQALSEGLYVAGYLTYEAGYAFEPSLHTLAPALGRLAWFAVYREPQIFDHNTEHITSAQREDSTATTPEVRLDLPAPEYLRRVKEIHRFIEAGDTYQANLTTSASWSTELTPLELYQSIVRAQPVEFAALIHHDGEHILSASPELFFRREGAHIVTKPMKGTAARGMDTKEDIERAAWLAADEKNRSENLMIVDLLRNDLGRICVPGSVLTTDLFQVEKFPTLFQMTSTVQGTLREEVRIFDLFRALFPSGSIVGAPKIHTMQILHQLEQKPRGVYTGAIGFFAPNGDATFSVAIRTIALKDGHASMGVGSGIVYDSDPAEEYFECLTKTAFLSRRTPAFDLLETVLWQDNAFVSLPEHLDRMAGSAEYFDFLFDRDAAEAALYQESRVFGYSGSHRVRLLHSRNGALTTSSSTIAAPSREAVTLLLSPHRTDAQDLYLRHKTTHRHLYDKELVHAQTHRCADALFLNTAGELTEGAIHNLFVFHDGLWHTPRLQSGVLPGIERAHLLHRRSNARESALTLDDLVSAEALAICNSVRGVRFVERVVKETPSGLTVVWESRTLPPIL